MSVPGRCVLRCLSSYFSRRYRQAEKSSFTVQARGYEVASAEATGRVSSAASPSQEEARKADILKAGRLGLLCCSQSELWEITLQEVDVSDCHSGQSRQFISVAFMISHTLKTIFKLSNILVFLCVKPSQASFYFVDEFSRVAQWPQGRECIWACVMCSDSGVKNKERKKREPSIMMSTQRQWGAALISVTCPCASHHLHYGSISHAPPANWIACEGVTMMRVRGASVLLLLQKLEESFPEKCCCCS